MCSSRQAKLDITILSELRLVRGLSTVLLSYPPLKDEEVDLVEGCLDLHVTDGLCTSVIGICKAATEFTELGYLFF